MKINIESAFEAQREDVKYELLPHSIDESQNDDESVWRWSLQRFIWDDVMLEWILDKVTIIN